MMVDEVMREFIASHFMLALTIYREAANESYEGKLGVAWTVINRSRHPKWWGDDPYSVVTKPMQYSSITAPGDKQLSRFPSLNDPKFRECFQIASDVLAGDVGNPVPGADSYFADYIDPPKWAVPEKFVKKIGRHLFYNLDGDPEAQHNDKEKPA